MRPMHLLPSRLRKMSADTVYYWANWALVFALVLGVLATFAVVRSGNIRDEALKRELGAQNERASGLQKQAEGLKIDVANAEKSATDAKIALEKYKAPRNLTQEQADTLRDTLRAFGGSAVDIFQFGETVESLNLSNQLATAFHDAYWVARSWTVSNAGAVQGILIMTNDGPSAHVDHIATALLAALHAAGLDASKIAKPPQWPAWGDLPGMLYGPPWDREHAAPIRLIVGQKL
jgi:hypothetical protein